MKKIKTKYIHIPVFVKEYNINSLNEYSKFMENYRNDRKYCPKCGHEEYDMSLIGYPLELDSTWKYKDMNECVCSKCGNKHIFDMRLPF
jgi:ribosomal protein S27AE